MRTEDYERRINFVVFPELVFPLYVQDYFPVYSELLHYPRGHRARGASPAHQQIKKRRFISYSLM